MFFEDSFPILWLYKSVNAVVGLEESLSKDTCRPVSDMILSLMDHTFYVFLTLSKYQSNRAVQFSKVAELNAGLVHEHSSLSEFDPCLDSSNYIEAWKSVTIIAKSLKEQINQQSRTLCDAQNFQKSDFNVDLLGVEEILPKGAGVEIDIARGELHDESGAAMTYSASSDIHDYSGSGSVHKV
ncbi:PREDICTED: Urb2/Npa2 [Prunus dulcis]|uniref:PREDICTED: Urb2/Npa2 n=1 Tax=Prunus dulcis TaxID=3755 RepID=A0A5E4G479_PRUDU|nr:PREDICTED: Urb2/Npa2 [Prunus dulcis]